MPEILVIHTCGQLTLDAVPTTRGKGKNGTTAVCHTDTAISSKWIEDLHVRTDPGN